MAKTAFINVQVDSEDKKLATEILNQIGVSMSGLINMTIKQVILTGGIPFEVKRKKSTKMTKELRDALKELDYIENNLEEYSKNHKWEDLKKELLSDD